MARGVRQGCPPASGFLFAMAFDPILRWLQHTIIPRNPDDLYFLQPAQCAYADDLAVAASCFRDLMTAVAPAFHPVDLFAGLNLNYRKCCWVQYGSEGRESLLRWLSDNCEEFREMQVVRCAKYVGTMIGPDGHIHRWTAPREKNQPARAENQPLPKVWSRDCDLKIYAVSVLSYIGSVCAPDQATFKAEALGLQCTIAGPYNAIPTGLLGVGSVCGLGPDLVGIHSISLAARYRTAACSNTLNQGLDKIQAARGYNFAPIFAAPNGKMNFLLFPWLVAPRKLSILYVVWTMMANLMRPHRIRSRKLPLPCSVANYMSRIFGGPISLRSSNILGPISRYRVADILPHMKLASRASRPGLTVGFLRILCNGLCTARRFHTEGDEQTCRVGCRDEPDSLLHCNECPLLYNIFVSIWEQATVLPRRSHLLHDLITQVLLRSLQYGIVVMGFIDAFVYAHHQHRRSIENPGKTGDCMKGRIRFMTAITSAYAHAHQVTCFL